MHFLPPEAPITLYETGFEEDLLGREKTGKTLSEVLDRIEDPLVVALDGRWGTGKSYFLQRWVGAHEHQNEGKALTVYFDAFANDYQSDPLVSLISTLANRLPGAQKSKLQQLQKVAKTFIRPATRLGLNLASLGAMEVLNDLGDAAVDAVKGEADKTLSAFWEREQGRQAAMEEFHAAIEALTKSEGTDEATPLVIVIDELDRCRPDYALDVLEVIKHFFAVPHVHFVLGVNLKALENSVKARYGAEIDATAYLQKFLSFTLELPDHVENGHTRTPNILAYARQIGEEMGIPNTILPEINEQLKVLSRTNHISIREVGKIMSTAALLPESATAECRLQGRRKLMVTLMIIKIIQPKLFSKFLNASVSRDELAKVFSATKRYTSLELDNGEYNQEYEHEVLILFETWNFICDPTRVEDKNLSGHIASSFYDFGRVWDANDILRKVNENWLSTFNLG
ncbi:KAP family P-loop NTPase fold protein [Aliiroseovarius crassostreae]|uniref:KAP family P-loop NTPase fold protein n=1 Tax=Aliiroseovarius crassostreae TaxID=154981 RepID=UPI00220FB430|nr:KAP family NTPase [Aliiroseovarius crassostreae]UWP89794.1 KAP family NTPase [Aliiroseovarius crassostreae]UWQ02443.1 KAP family NTPase [Aliiroseovarius crassostreae]